MAVGLGLRTSLTTQSILEPALAFGQESCSSKAAHGCTKHHQLCVSFVGTGSVAFGAEGAGFKVGISTPAPSMETPRLEQLSYGLFVEEGGVEFGAERRVWGTDRTRSRVTRKGKESMCRTCKIAGQAKACVGRKQWRIRT